MSLRVVRGIAGDDGQAVVQGGCGDDEVGLGEGVASLAAFLDQEAPLKHDVLGDRQDALLKHRPHLVCEPIMQLGAAAGVGDELDAKPEFGEGYRADKEAIERLRPDEGDHFRLWPRAT